MDPLEIFLVAVPGLEQPVAEEAAEHRFVGVTVQPGGVVVGGGWDEVMRANLVLRGPSRVLVRIGAFRALHLAQLDKRMRKFPWGEVLRPDVPVKVDATCHASRIYHAGAVVSRVARAIHEELGAPIATDPKAEAPVSVKVRIDDDLCTISVDSSGESLHKRGHKAQVNKAPMRENMAAMFLRLCGYDGQETVVDPMCGSGTFVIEAAEIAARLMPGRSRAFAFEKLAGFDPAAWSALKQPQPITPTTLRFHGSDRDAGAIAMSKANADRAGIGALCTFHAKTVSDLTPPDGPPGLVIVNPPYGMRIGERKPLFALYGALGRTLQDRFSGWRIGIIATDAGLAQATGLPFLPPGPPVSHGGLKVSLYRTAPLP